MSNPDSPRGLLARAAAPLAIGLLVVSGISIAGLVRERRHSKELTTSNQALLISLRQVQDQVQAVSEKLNAIATQPAPAPLPPPVAAPPEPARTARAAAATPRKPVRPADDVRWRQVQTKLADHDKLIGTTREEAGQARRDLEAGISSTRDELSGSIARTNDELGLLQKRGERNYYEFQITKSKQFRPVGPLSVSLRKANVKGAWYDLVLVVDDRQLEKKHVSLYEPILFTLSDRPQPVEFVVNQISKDLVKGYVSEPKYRKSELTAASAAPKPAAADPKVLQRR